MGCDLEDDECRHGRRAALCSECSLYEDLARLRADLAAARAEATQSIRIRDERLAAYQERAAAWEAKARAAADALCAVTDERDRERAAREAAEKLVDEVAKQKCIPKSFGRGWKCPVPGGGVCLPCRARAQRDARRW